MATNTTVDYSKDALSESEEVDINATGELTAKGEKLTSNHDKTGINISPSVFCDILKEKRQVLMRPMLLMTGGLPKSGKSQAIRQLLQLESDEISRDGFAYYNMISVGIKQTKMPNSQLFHDFGFLAGLKTSLHNDNQMLYSFNEDGPRSALDSEDIHHKHRMALKATWEKLNDESAEVQLSEGPALVKIWDVAFDSFLASQFLSCFNGHFYNSYTWSFIDVERDLPKLYSPPSVDDTQLIARRSRIQYLLNPSKLSSKLNGERHAVCTIYAMHKHNINRLFLQNQVSMLQEECKIASPQIGCSKLIAKDVIPLSSNSSNKEILLNQLHQIAQASTASQMIPLSHMFLRGSLELESSVFMRREELMRKARLCGIDDDSFDEFCKSFTSFGSIIDVGLVSTSDIIIIKPDEFLTTLDQAFNLKTIFKVVYDGILKSDVAPSLFGNDHQLFLEVLEAVCLVTPVAGGQCVPSQNVVCYYIPPLRLNGQEMFFNPNQIQLVTSMCYPSINLTVALTKHLLQAIPSSQLLFTMDRNKTRIKSHEGEVEIIFHGEVIEFAVFQDKRFIEEIVKACKKLPYQLMNRYGEAEFYFAILCNHCEKLHDNYIGLNFNRKHHILPFDDLDCDRCRLTENVKIWSSTIKEANLDEKFKVNGSLKEDDIKKLAREISTYERVHVLSFIEALGQDRPLPEDQFKWLGVLGAAIADWKNQPHKESTKKKMSEILIELHTKFEQSHTKTMQKIEQLARELSLQTLTMEQIKELSKYHQDNNQAKEIQKLSSQILELHQLNMKREKKLQNIIQQLHNFENYPIEFNNQAGHEIGHIIGALEKAIQEREVHFSEVQNEKDNHLADLQRVSDELKIKVIEKDRHIAHLKKTVDTSIDNSQPVVDDNVQKWCSEGGTSMKPKKALRNIGRTDVISGIHDLKQTSNDDICSPADTFEGLLRVGKKSDSYKADSEHEITLKECGLKLFIPEGVVTPPESYEAVAEGLWGGDFIFPEGTNLISGVCYISISSSSHLNKPVTVQLEHCANIIHQDQVKYLSFVIANSDRPPYQFQLISGGIFNMHTRHGTISLKKFSLVAIVCISSAFLIQPVSDLILPFAGTVASVSTSLALNGSVYGIAISAVIGLILYKWLADPIPEPAVQPAGPVPEPEVPNFQPAAGPVPEPEVLNFQPAVPVPEPAVANFQPAGPIPEPEVLNFRPAGPIPEVEVPVPATGSILENNLEAIKNSPPNNLYQALVMYKSDYKKFVMNFVVIQANKYSEYIQHSSSSNLGEVEHKFCFEFSESKKLALSNFPEDKTNGLNEIDDDEWEIIPLSQPAIIKEKEVIDFTESKNSSLPYITVVIQPQGSNCKKILKHVLNVEGTDQPHRTITIYKSCDDLLIQSSAASSFSGAQPIPSTNEAPRLKDLLTILADISSVWELIGLALDVDNNTITGLTMKVANDKVKLYEVLKSWIDKDESVTWKTIIDAVEGPIIDNMAQGRKIREFLSQPKKY